MKVTPLEIPDVLLVEPWIIADSRGYFGETFRADRYDATIKAASWPSAGIDGPFVQDNVSVSHHRVLRGLHFQHPKGQGKLVYALRGEVFDVAVDVRVGSATYGLWVGTVLSEANCRQVYVPPGFAHGFVVTSSSGAMVAYKCSEYYSPQTEQCIRWDDPDLSIGWPVADPILSQKDMSAPLLRDVPRDRVPRFRPPPATP